MRRRTGPKKAPVCAAPIVDTGNVAFVKKRLIRKGKALQVAAFFKTLSDPARMQVIEALAIRRLCVCDLAALLGMSQSSASHHLRTLRDKGIVKYHKTGRIVRYSLDDAHVSRAFAAALRHALHKRPG